MAFAAVLLGAFGSHGLRSKVSPESLAVFQTGVQYQMMHALALVFVALLADKLAATGLVLTAGWFFFAGIILFSGSLYALSISGIKRLGAITPLGGLSFLLGWILLMVAVFQGI